MSLPEKFDRAQEQPPIVEFWTVDHVFIKQMLIAKKGTFIPQHAHVYEHASMLVSGSVRLYRDGQHEADYQAPACLTIPAGAKHLFEALEDNTTLWCIHNCMRKEIVEILDEHEII